MRLRGIVLAVAWAVCAHALAQGVNVGEPSKLRKLVPAEQLEQTATQEYEQLKRQAAAKQALAGGDHPQVKRLRAIAAKLIPYANRFNPRAARWKWEINLIGSKQINAFCMPGGKIAFYTGILDQLKLTDDEVAVVMGHEIAHAVAEHGNERMSQGLIAQFGGVALSAALQNKPQQTQQLWMTAFGVGAQYGAILPFGRKQESEADHMGLIFMALGGYDPNQAVTFWQRMAQSGGAKPPEFLSTHPSDATRIADIQKELPEALSYYKK